MSTKCVFCDDTKEEPGVGPCVWCEQVEARTSAEPEITRYSESNMEGGGVAPNRNGELCDFHHVARLVAEREALQMLLNERDEQLDAQRLRADTAEAEADQFRESSAQLATDLIAAEQRIAEHLKVFNTALFRLETFIEAEREMPIPTMEVLLDAIRRQFAALHPNPEAESHQVAREALKMENQRITPARFKCLACGDYHEGSGNLPCPKMVATSVILKAGAYKKLED